MHPCLILFLLLWMPSSAIGKYVFVRQHEDWDEALTHCRNFYTDLAPITSEYDTELLKQLAGDYHTFIWFGLMRNTSDPDRWMWSGGGEVTRFDWDVRQPDKTAESLYGQLLNYRWHDVPSYAASYFFCYSVHVVREEKTWDEAMEHCKEHHKVLASISSETEMMLVQRELNRDVSTQHVWMGLRFLAGEWLWLDGNAAGFEAWGQGDKPECPGERLSCGVLVLNGGRVRKWKAHNCGERLHFICY